MREASKGSVGGRGCPAWLHRVAYAHHKDDFVETMLMSMIFQGKFYAFPPVTLFEDKNLRVIRPLMLVEESQVKGFVKRQEFPVLKKPLPD